MKQAYIGVDIIEIDRIRETVFRWGERFLRRVYTAAEIEVCGGKAESLAARFAGKEAAIKALSTPGSAIGWRDIEILPGKEGKPLIRLHGQARVQAAKLELDGLEISLSHSRDNAIAMVIGFGKEF
jgi:holo-[acyl-carrier protein] synthase